MLRGYIVEVRPAATRARASRKTPRASSGEKSRDLCHSITIEGGGDRRPEAGLAFISLYCPLVRAIDIIAKKRDGGALDREEIAFAVAGATSGTVPDYQTSALLMAILLRGMSTEERRG